MDNYKLLFYMMFLMCIYMFVCDLNGNLYILAAVIVVAVLFHAAFAAGAFGGIGKRNVYKLTHTEMQVHGSTCTEAEINNSQYGSNQLFQCMVVKRED